MAHRFEFSPHRIQLKRGSRTTLELVSLDVVHGFAISGPGLNVRTDVVPGHVTHLELPPQSVGTYAIRCDVFCGDGHDEMAATLIVTE